MFTAPRHVLIIAAYVESALGLYLVPSLHAQDNTGPTPAELQQPSAACDFSSLPGAVWWGTEGRLSIEQLAAYIAPVYWFSPDEPLLHRAEGAEIRLPEALPFETAPDAPVVYYQFDEIVIEQDAQVSAYIEDTTDKGASVIDLERVGAIKLSYFAYFSDEEGVGAHEHDVEEAEFKIVVLRSTGDYMREHGDIVCDELYYITIVTRVSAKAHGIRWFWNVLDVTEDTKFPMFLLVEEGKHGLATDRNSDGYYTPGYDVSRHINDAWGVRDVIRSGALFTGGYQNWMTKVRRPEHRVFPPLPEDSPLRTELARRGDYDEAYVEYELRPFPPADRAGDDRRLYRFMAAKEVQGWPDVNEASELQEVIDWLEEGAVEKSLSIALYADGDLGVSWVFPFFIVRNFEDPLSGGFLVWRMYLKDRRPRDFGWMLMYTPSASRWIDTYLAAGVEWNTQVIDGTSSRNADFVLETGLKFRANISTTPLRFLTFFTDFWGLRVGIKNRGFFDIERFTYVFEIGAGAW